MKHDTLLRLVERPISEREERALRRLLRGSQPPAAPAVDLGMMTCQERLGALCRAAERVGVL